MMIKSITFLFIASLLCVNYSFSQKPSVEWSQLMEYKDSEFGFMQNFIDGNEQYVYAIYTEDQTDNYDPEPKKIGITAFDKKTMSKVAFVGLKGFSQSKLDPAVKEKMDFKTVIIRNEFVYVFWTKRTDVSQELYVSTYDQLLKTISFKKVITIDLPVGMKRIFPMYLQHSLFTVLSNSTREEIVIGWEMPHLNSFTEFHYGVLDSDFQFAKTGQVTLPVKLGKVYKELMGRYTYLENGDIVVNNSYTAEEKGNTDILIDGGIKMSDINFYYTLTYINTAEQEIAVVELPDRHRYSKDLNFALCGNMLQIYGLYCDLDKDPNCSSIQGIYNASVNTETMETNNKNYIELEKSLLEKIFRYEENQPVGEIDFNRGGIMIDSVINMDDKSCVLVLTKVNYSSVYSRGAITLINLDLDQEILWSSKIYRSIIYAGGNSMHDSRLFARDIKVLDHDSDLFIIYGDKDESTQVAMFRSAFKDKLFYSSINKVNGEMSSNGNFNLNEANPQHIKDTFLPSALIEGNELYIHYTHLKKKEGAVGVISID